MRLRTTFPPPKLARKKRDWNNTLLSLGYVSLVFNLYMPDMKNGRSRKRNGRFCVLDFCSRKRDAIKIMLLMNTNAFENKEKIP
ncbi:MAG: hypothetical protein CSA11_03235 [Chloroflexi bacterium]|nr:MAG: hypothetical protein CSA11_03235 [Chloroflexota bacterium]